MVCEWKTPLSHRIAIRGLVYLEGNYDVYYGDSVAGNVSIDREGLYYRIVFLTGKLFPGFLRLMLSSGEETINLGICIPRGNQLYLEKKIAAKTFPKGNIQFLLSNGELSKSENFIPLMEDRPITMLSKLIHGKFTVRNGVPGVLMEDSSDA